MTTFYLLPSTSISPSNQQVDDIAYLLKKGRVERLMLTTFDLWKGRGRRHDVSYIESVKVPPSTSRSTEIDVAGSIFENYRSFTLANDFAFSPYFGLASGVWDVNMNRTTKLLTKLLQCFFNVLVQLTW